MSIQEVDFLNSYQTNWTPDREHVWDPILQQRIPVHESRDEKGSRIIDFCLYKRVFMPLHIFNTQLALLFFNAEATKT